MYCLISYAAGIEPAPPLMRSASNYTMHKLLGKVAICKRFYGYSEELPFSVFSTDIYSPCSAVHTGLEPVVSGVTGRHSKPTKLMHQDRIPVLSLPRFLVCRHERVAALRRNPSKLYSLSRCPHWNRTNVS